MHSLKLWGSSHYRRGNGGKNRIMAYKPILNIITVRMYVKKGERSSIEQAVSANYCNGE